MENPRRDSKVTRSGRFDSRETQNALKVAEGRRKQQLPSFFAAKTRWDRNWLSALLLPWWRIFTESLCGICAISEISVGFWTTRRCQTTSGTIAFHRARF
jgi:hypothetical protein